MGEENRLTPDGLDAALDGMYAMETRRAEEAEALVRGHIAALEAEIDRLRPSGQVAEDVAFIADQRAQCHAAMLMLTDAQREAVMRVKHHGDMPSDISRLSAKAQGYEAMEERCKVEITKAITAESERDAAVADNAALLKALGDARDALGRAQVNIGWGTPPRLACGLAYDAAGTVIAQPHPGAALLERHRTDVEEARVGTRHALRRISDVLAERGVTVADATSLSAVIDGIDKAMVRARNEGLELVRVEAERQCAAYSMLTSDTAKDRAAMFRDLALDIAELKEPEQ